MSNTTPHRATAEQWAYAGAFAFNTRACILELRARVEALEAANEARADEDDASPTDSLVERVSHIVNGFQPAVDDSDPFARAVIREVAAWMRSELVSRNMAERLEQEVDRG